MELNPALIEEDAAAASFLTLPDPVLIYLLKKLPQHDRLASAALVCQTFAAAAAAATTVVSLATVNAATAAGLSSWLQQHGRGAVEAIRVPTSPHDQVQLKLPGAGLPKLQQLLLHNCALEFTSSSSAVQDWPAVVLPALRNIYLNSCKEPFDILSQLQCPKLTALQLYPSMEQVPSWMDPATDSQQQELDATLSNILQRLPELVSLGLGHDQLTALPQLGCLQKLQQCRFCCPQATPETLQSLSSSLTSLVLMCGRGVLQESYLPAAGWPHLKELEVSHHPMQPAALSRLTALESLSLTDCVLVPHPNRIHPRPQPYDIREAKEGAAQLMAALAPLTNLKRLDLTDILLESLLIEGDSAHQAEGAAAADSPNRFSALTASSVLESLTLAYRSPGLQNNLVQPLPPGAVSALFPPGRQLTALTELVLDGMDPDLVAELAEDAEHEHDLETDPYNTTTCMRDSDLPLLLEACPGLQRLTLNSVLPRWCNELYPFLLGAKDRMQQLTYLCLGGLCLMDDDAPALGFVTSLRELELHNAPELGPDGLAHLTELRQLSRLQLRGIGYRRCLGCSFVSIFETDQPDVWQQLHAELPELREQEWEVQEDYEGEDEDTESYDSDDDYTTDSSDSDEIEGRRLF